MLLLRLPLTDRGLEVGGFIRRAGSLALSMSRELTNASNAGSVENARRQVDRAGTRRSAERALETDTTASDGDR